MNWISITYARNGHLGRKMIDVADLKREAVIDGLSGAEIQKYLRRRYPAEGMQLVTWNAADAVVSGPLRVRILAVRVHFFLEGEEASIVVEGDRLKQVCGREVQTWLRERYPGQSVLLRSVETERRSDW